MLALASAVTLCGCGDSGTDADQETVEAPATSSGSMDEQPAMEAPAEEDSSEAETEGDFAE